MRRLRLVSHHLHHSLKLLTKSGLARPTPKTSLWMVRVWKRNLGMRRSTNLRFVKEILLAMGSRHKKTVRMKERNSGNEKARICWTVRRFQNASADSAVYLRGRRDSRAAIAHICLRFFKMFSLCSSLLLSPRFRTS